jgi:acetolactate synthase I/II/III large subunit
MNWMRIASGMGVEASRVTTAQEFADQYGAAMKQRGPRLVEAVL